MPKLDARSGNWEADVVKNTIRLLGWTAAWVISLAVLRIGTEYLWEFNTSITVPMVLVNVAIGVGMIIAHIRHLKAQDELQQRIFLEAAALTLGVLLVFGGSYQLWADLKLISFEPQVWHMVALLGLANIVATVIAMRRYR